jgi:hypothetical protein
MSKYVDVKGFRATSDPVCDTGECIMLYFARKYWIIGSCACQDLSGLSVRKDVWARFLPQHRFPTRALNISVFCVKEQTFCPVHLLVEEVRPCEVKWRQAFDFPEIQISLLEPFSFKDENQWRRLQTAVGKLLIKGLRNGRRAWKQNFVCEYLVGISKGSWN